MSGRIFNDDCFDVLRDVANECLNPVIVTDPPFNIGYHYRDTPDFTLVRRPYKNPNDKRIPGLRPTRSRT